MNQRRPIYLDYNATTPVDPGVARAMMPYLTEKFGNPSSSHSYGLETRRAVEVARQQVAQLIGAEPHEILFTSGGSESNNMVIKGLAGLRGRGHVVSTAVEHPATLEPCEALRRAGYSVTLVGVDAGGRVDPQEVEAALTSDTILVSVMHANNEVGTIQPIAEIAGLLRERGIPFHTDAAQTLGKLSVRVDELGIDFLSIAGHKVYAPKGIGALYLRGGKNLPRLIDGADHESGRRAGTENVLEIVGLGEACAIAAGDLERATEHSRELRDRLWNGLRERLPGLHRHGDPERCLPNTLSVAFRGIEAGTLLSEIGDRVAASAGAACHADGEDLSGVLLAMQVPAELAMGTVRFSVGRFSTREEIDEAIDCIASAAERLGGGDAGSPGPAAESAGQIRLTRFTRGMGCACKLRPRDLEAVLSALPPRTDKDVLVGLGGFDDAAVVRLRDDLAVVQSVDFFTPIADDAYDFGAISAANSLSDLYAMGAEPRFALSIVGFPANRLPLDLLRRILEGAADTAREAGIEIVGGHTIDDPEPKFGLAVTGIVHPERIWRNAGGRPGDALLLTKPIGTGIIATATKLDQAEASVIAGALDSMRTLNRVAYETLLDFEVRAATDVTGFGLLGHLLELCAASQVDAEIEIDQVPLLDGAAALAAAGVVPGGSRDNLSHVEARVVWRDGDSPARRLLLADAQTSGGLLVAVDADRAAEAIQALHDAGVTATRQVGSLRARTGDRETVRIV